MWTANAPALLLLLPCSCIAPGLLLACSQPAPGLLIVCSCPAPDPAHPSFAAFIIISTLRLFSARREPPFMVSHPVLSFFPSTYLSLALPYKSVEMCIQKHSIFASADLRLVDFYVELQTGAHIQHFFRT